MYAAATMIRCEPELRDALDLLAERAGRSCSAEIRRALWRHVEIEAAAIPDPESANAGLPTPDARRRLTQEPAGAG